jgi:hypothetical protein
MTDKREQKTGEESRETSLPAVDERPDTADNRDYRGPAPQSGRGTPSQAEGEREDRD